MGKPRADPATSESTTKHKAIAALAAGTVAGMIALGGAEAAYACPAGSTTLFTANNGVQVCDTHGIDPATLMPPPAPARVPAPNIAPAPVPAPVPAPYVPPAPAAPQVPYVPTTTNHEVPAQSELVAPVQAEAPDDAAAIQAKADADAKAQVDAEAAAKAQADAEAAAKVKSDADATAKAKASASPTPSVAVEKASLDMVSSDTNFNPSGLIGGILATVLVLGSAAVLWLKRIGGKPHAWIPWKRS